MIEALYRIAAVAFATDAEVRAMFNENLLLRGRAWRRTRAEPEESPPPATSTAQ